MCTASLHLHLLGAGIGGVYGRGVVELLGWIFGMQISQSLFGGRDQKAAHTQLHHMRKSFALQREKDVKQ